MHSEALAAWALVVVVDLAAEELLDFSWAGTVEMVEISAERILRRRLLRRTLELAEVAGVEP